MSQIQRKAVVRQVRDRRELEQALKLVHDNYVQCGYMKPDPSGIRISVYYASPMTRTFVAVLGEEVVATVSLFCDSPLGLPMDGLYASELHLLRDEGRYVGEVGMLADRRQSLRRGVPILLQMMKHLFEAARKETLSDLLITVNPKHKGFYERVLCFKEYGSQKDYQAVNGAPAVLLRVNMVDLRKEDLKKESIRKLFFSSMPQGAAYHSNYRMQPGDLKYFFLEKTNIFRQVKPETLWAIEGLYPGLKLEDPEAVTVA